MTYTLGRGCLVWSAAMLLSFTQASLAATCPVTPTDTVIPISDFDPPPLPGEPALSIDGLFEFVQRQGVSSVAQLLSRLPERLNKNYALVETTRTLGNASLQYPRIIMFGSDAQLMINVATDPGDADYERLDLIHLNRASGVWEFAQLDFTTASPNLAKDPAGCADCHGDPKRPIWGTYLEWPGVVGDDPAPGPQAETLTTEHAERLTQLKAGQGNPDRFHSLQWAREYRPGGAQFLTDHVYGYAMSVFNMELAFAVAESVFLRMKTGSPERFRELREELLLLGYFDRRNRLLGGAERQRIADLIAGFGGQGDTVDDLFSLLGIDTANEFSLDRLATEAPDTGWNIGAGDLYGLVYALILNDLAESDPKVRAILENGPNDYGIFTCPSLGQSTMDVLKYKILHGWTLRGAARQAVHEVFFGIDLDRIYGPVLEQVAQPLYDHLRSGISSPQPADGGGSEGPTDPVEPPDPDTAPGPLTVADVCAGQPPRTEGRLEGGDAICVPDSRHKRYYWIWIPDGIERLTLGLGNGSGNGDLYYNPETWATEDAFVRRSVNSGNREVIEVSDPPSGYHYVTVVANPSVGGVSLAATFD